MLLTIIFIFTAYLIGSISSAILVCKSMRLPDPRKNGSKNPGATNVLRIGGKKAAAITLLGDMLKGLVPVLAGRWVGLDSVELSLIAFAAFIGHLYPIYFHFEGGKGVATMIGTLLALSFPTGLCWLATWLSIAAIFRYSSLAALVSSVLAPLYMSYFTADWIFVAVTSLMSLILIIRHRSNIQNLLRGKEGKLGVS